MTRKLKQYRITKTIRQGKARSDIVTINDDGTVTAEVSQPVRKEQEKRA